MGTEACGYTECFSHACPVHSPSVCALEPGQAVCMLGHADLVGISVGGHHQQTRHQAPRHLLEGLQKDRQKHLQRAMMSWNLWICEDSMFITKCKLWFTGILGQCTCAASLFTKVAMIECFPPFLERGPLPATYSVTPAVSLGHAMDTCHACSMIGPVFESDTPPEASHRPHW